MAKSRARKLADIIVGAGVDIDGNLTFSGGSTSDDLTFADNDKANFGTSSDLQIYHNGSHSFIKDAGTGDLYIGASNNLALMNSAFSENYLLGTTDGAVTLYYDGSSKLATFSGGVSVTGQVNATTMHLPDGSTGLQLGSSNDTKFFHDGSNSKITHSGSGGFYIGADTLGLQTGAHNENYLTAAANGAVSLYYDNSAKLATASGGITVTGETNTSTLASGNSTMTGLVQIGNSSGGTLFFKRPNANYIFADQTGGYLVFGTNGRSTMVSNSNFYLGTDQSSTFVGSVSFNDSISADGPITINGSGSEDRYLQFALDGRSSAFTGQNAAFIFCGQGGSGDFLAGGLYLQSRSATAGREIGFITGTTPAKRMVIDASGNVGINTASPSARFEVTGDAIQLTNGSYFKAVQTTNSANAGYYMASGSSNWYTLVDTSGRYQIYDGDAAAVRVIVDGSGDVGIGTTSPQALLHLNSASDTYFIIGTTNSTADGRIQFRNSAGTDAGGLWYNTSGNRMMFRTNSQERMRITSAGNVGIGTDSPESLLTLENDDATLRIRSATTTTKGLTLRYNDSGNFGQLLVDHQGNNQLAMKYYALSHSFGRSDSDVNITMDDSGRLLVGATTTNASSSERFLVSSTGSQHSRFVNAHDSFSTVYIKNTSTTADTNQPFLTFQDTGGNRGNFGLRYSTAQLVIQGHGGVGIAGGSGGISQDPDFFVDSSGNVGIGTSSPSTVHGNTVLQVSGTTGAEVVVHRNDAGAELHDYIGGFLFYNGDTSGSDPHYSGMIGKASDIYGSSNLEFYAGRGALEDHTNATPHMIIVGDSNDNSKVGINTDSPAYILDVNGTAQFSPGSSAALFQEYANGMALWLDGSDGDFIGGDYFGIHAYGTTSLDFSYGAATKFKMLSDGRVGINRTPSITNSKLEVGGADDVPLINVEASGNTGGIGIGSNGLQLFHGSSSKVTINSSGNVGIGVSSIPSWANLITNGTVAVGGVLYIKDSQKIQGLTGFPGSASNLILNPDGGNVGIGTTNPSSKLEVNNPSGAGNGSAQEIARFVNTASGATSMYLYLGASSGTDWRLGKNVSGIANNTNFSIADNGGSRKLDLTPDGHLALGITDPSNPKHRKVEVTPTVAVTSTAWSTSTGNNGGYDVKSDDSSTYSNYGGVTVAGVYNRHVAEWELHGNMSANTWYPVATMDQLMTWQDQTGSSQISGFSMYFRLYAYDVGAGGPTYLSSAMTERIWVNGYTSNSTQEHRIHVGPWMGHAPNHSPTLYSTSQHYQLRIHHHLNNETYYAAQPVLEILVTSARTGLDGTGSKVLNIYGYVG